MPVPMSKVH